MLLEKQIHLHVLEYEFTKNKRLTQWPLPGHRKAKVDFCVGINCKIYESE